MFHPIPKENHCEPATAATGYRHPSYARALEEFGKPHFLRLSKGCVLISAIDGSEAYDARGCYPLFCCQDWKRISDDLEELTDSVVSLMLVTDPFGDYDPQALADSFPDLFRPYKEHFVVDLTRPIESTISKTHARYARQAARTVEVERVADPKRFAHQWISLYSHLVQRNQVQGIAAFSHDSLRRQLEVPGLELFRAVLNGETVAAILYYLHEGVAYYHLGASSDKGYENRASYALFGESLAYFKSRARWVCLGAGAGSTNNGGDGLTRFKRGWATGTRTAHICGRIFDSLQYQKLVCARKDTVAGYFPLYRSPAS